jgi:hypothetical protein
MKPGFTDGSMWVSPFSFAFSWVSPFSFSPMWVSLFSLFSQIRHVIGILTLP